MSSLTPNLCVGSSQVDRLHLLGPPRRHLGGERADVARRQPVGRVRVGEDSTPAASSSARNRSEPSPAASGARGSRGDPLGRRASGAATNGSQTTLAVGLVKRREDLARGGRRSAPGAGGPGALGRVDAARERGERAHRRERQPAALRQRPRGRDPDPQPGEGARADPDRDQPDRLPAAGRLDRRLDLGEQRRGMARAPAGPGLGRALADELARRGSRRRRVSAVAVSNPRTAVRSLLTPHIGRLVEH